MLGREISLKEGRMISLKSYALSFNPMVQERRKDFSEAREEDFGEILSLLSQPHDEAREGSPAVPLAK